MLKNLQKIVLLGMMFILFGCENVRDDAYNNKSLGVKNIDQEIANENKLETYSVKSIYEDEEIILSGMKWKIVEADLDQFGIKKLSGNFGYQDYLIDMKFSENEVVVYADCFKIKAKYKQESKRIYFSKVTQNIAYDMKTCIESEDADQVMYSFFQHDYKIETLKRDSITFRSVDIDAIVVFKNR